MRSIRTNGFGLVAVAVATTLASALVATTAEAQYPGQPYAPGQPYPAGPVVYVAPAPRPMRARIVHRSTPALWITGISLLGVGYLAFLPVSGWEAAAVIPVAGPWIVAATMECSGDFEDLCGLGRGLVVFDALLQTTGAVLLAIGLAGRDVTVYEAARADPPRFRVSPWAIREAAGIAVSGVL